MPLHDALFVETSPAPVKYAASLLGRCTPEVRQPLWQLMPETQGEGAAGDARRRPDQLSAERRTGGAMRTTDRYAALNRRARHDYLIEDTLEAGLVLHGTEVKSLRQGGASIAEAYAGEQGGELFLVNANIPEYKASAHFNHQPRRPRKLLLHRKQVDRLLGRGPARGRHDRAAGALFQRARPRQGRARPRQGQAQGRQAARPSATATGSAARRACFARAIYSE